MTLLIRSWVWLVIGCVVLAGCTGGHAPPPPADPNQAGAAVRNVLDKWQQGSTPAELHKQRPSILVVDEDWEKGCKLTGYEIVSQPQSDGHNSRIDVQLDVEKPEGVQRIVVQYRVSTSSQISVIRQDE